jgi:cysteinyl-tRNA synthetase
MPLELYDTLTASKRPLETVEPGRVGMYVCGLTVYDYAHVGHARTYTIFDVLRRYLAHRGYQVRFVRNHTDVDDKIIKRAAELGEDPLALADRFIGEFDRDLQALGVLPPDVAPRVTREIPSIIDMIQRLVDRGHAYAVNGSVFFEVSTFSEYGKLSRKKVEDLRAGERVEVDPDKRQPGDFALWKAAKPGEPKWPSPWGEGRPGWHIECSAMSTHYLGETFDIHGGGRDLVFPHHENEIAQSEGATGKPFVSFWVHAGTLTIEGEKMSKSLGNLVFVSDLLKQTDPRAIRLALMHHHYRAGFEWHDTDLDDGTALLHRLLAAAERPDGADPRPYAARVRAAIDHDLDAPRALEALDDLASAILSGGGDTTAPAVLRELGALIGVDLSRNS